MTCTPAAASVSRKASEQRIPIRINALVVRQPSLASVTLRLTGASRRVGLRRNPGDLDSARREVDDEEHRKPRQPAIGQTSTVKKSVAARTSQ
jgi:hypothetical protein